LNHLKKQTQRKINEIVVEKNQSLRSNLLLVCRYI